MNSILHILHLEDTEADAELVAFSLRQQGVICELERVSSREGYVAALQRGGIDVVLSDFSLPHFDGMTALDLLREVHPEVPFIFVTGTMGEEVAINALQRGAIDYVFKHRLPRLGPAVRRAVADAEKRRDLQRAETAMIQSEHKYRQLFECLSEAALLAEARTGRIVDTNRQAEVLLGRSRSEILGTSVETLLSPETLKEYRQRLIAPAFSQDRVVFEGEIIPRDSHSIAVAISAAPIVLHGRQLVLGLYRDLTAHKQTEQELLRLRELLATQTGAARPVEAAAARELLP
jgi:PAS domain S-box-containing protein